MATKQTWLTMDQATERTGLSRNTIQKAIATNEIDSAMRQVEGASKLKLRYVEEESLREWFAAREAKGHFSGGGRADGRRAYVIYLTAEEAEALGQQGHTLRLKNQHKAKDGDSDTDEAAGSDEE